MSVKPKLFRDPVHDTIAIPGHTATGRLLLALIDTPEMQRLRRIRQLGLSFLVYPGAEHSRFAHSLGVTWLAFSVLERLGRLTGISEHQKMVSLAAGLLHDVGHGPFSHALEAVTDIDHEIWSEGIILDPDSDVNRVLREVDGSLPQLVAGRLSKAPTDDPDFLVEVVSSQLDADRLDYILRDGHATGVRIGAYDLQRILALLDVADGHLAVNIGAQEAVEGYLLARFHMYKQVYLHKTGRAAERMLEFALRRAAQLKKDNHPFAYWPKGPLGRLIAGEPLSNVAFATLDDMDLWVAMKHWADESDQVLADLCGGLVHRRLYKPYRLPDEARRAAELVDAARSVARVQGLDPDYAVLEDRCSDSPYRPFTGVGKRNRSIRLVDGGGRISFIEDRSEVVKLLGQLTVKQHLMCVHPALRERVARVMA